MAQLSGRPLARLLLTATSTLALATLAVAVLQDGLGVPNPSAVYLVAVVAVAFVSGSVGGILASIASFLLYDFLFVEPRYTFTIALPGEWVSVLLLLFVGVVVGQLAALQRSRTDLAQAREREARALFRLSRALATRESTPAALAEIAQVLRERTASQRVWITLGDDEAAERVAADTAPDVRRPEPGLLHVLRRMPGDVPAEWVRIHHRVAKAKDRRGRDTAPASSPPAATFRVRIEASGVPFGSIWSTREHATPPDPTETRLFSAAADQVGQALGHDRLRAERQASEIARQSDAIKSSLLQSVSHDLRTPLATIRAAAGSLRPGSGLTTDEQRESAEAIDREVEYLNRLVTNLLDLSRIEAGVLRAEREVFELDDLLGRSIDRLRARLGSRPLEVQLTDQPVVVDPVLLDQAFTNVVENAIKYTPADTPLRVSAIKEGANVRLTVEDGGTGVPDDALPRLFDKFYRVPQVRRSSRAGTGIGLAVVRGLLEAMGGSASARRSELGGLAIDLVVPAVAPAPSP